MNAADSISEKIAWGPWIIGVSGVVLCLVGAVRFLLRQRFGSIDTFYCCLVIVPSGFFLLVFSYLLQYAKLASIILLFMGRNSDFLVPRNRCCARIDHDGGRSSSCARGMEKQKWSAAIYRSARWVECGRQVNVMRITDCCEPSTLEWIHGQPLLGDGDSE